MIYTKSVHIFENSQGIRTVSAYVTLKPAGEVRVDLTLPDKFCDCILDAAQAAADLHEQQMKAAILAEL